MVILVDLKFFNIINYAISISISIFIFISTLISTLKAIYNYKIKTKFSLIPIKIVVRKATIVIKGVITYKYNIV